MNITELAQEWSLSPDTLHAVLRAEEMTGKPMEFRFVSEMVSHAKLKVARSTMDSHIVYLKMDKLSNINHLIIHECYHIYRFWSVSNRNRKVLASNRIDNQIVIGKWKKELGKRGEVYPPQIFEMWHNGFMTLFYNAVTDTRIERSMFQEYPNVREEQLRSLKVLEQEIKAGMTKEVEKMTPPSLFLLAGAVNYVFLKQLEPIIGRQWRKTFKGYPDILTLGNRLLRCVPDDDKGLSQDIAILDKWSAILGVSIQWNDFEDIPSTYAMEY